MKRSVCSFCGKQADICLKGANDVIICYDCSQKASELTQEIAEQVGYLAKEQIEIDDEDGVPVFDLTPSQIMAHLNEHVIGQEEAKKTLAVSVYNHYKRIMQKETDDGVEIQKSNVLMIGSSGVGKTELARSIAKILQVPFCIADATTLTQAGYVGDDVENVLTRLLQSADGDVAKAERGIIFIDEIDKVGRKGEGTSITRDVSGEGVQHALLKIIEGTESRVPVNGGRKHPQGDHAMVKTHNILFICGGAFEGLQKIVERKNKTSQSIGFGNISINGEFFDWQEEVETDDLIKYGLVPELIGRLPVLTMLKDLSKNDLKRILLEPKNAITKQYVKLFAIDNVVLEFEESAIDEIAEQAIIRKIGARGLRSILEKAMKQIMFDMPDQKNVKKVIINDEVIRDGEEPRYEYVSEVA
jgi:ATP-dependent Clp protease ATP-binding subunit ClpX